MFIIRAAGFAAVAWSLFQLYTAGIGFFHVMVQRPLHLGFALVVSFLSYPGRRGRAGEVQVVPGKWELALALAAAAAAGYLVLERQRVIQRIAFVDPVRSADSLVCMLLIFLTLEAARRILGPAVPAVACCFLGYLFLGPFIPVDMLAHSGINLAGFTDLQMLSPQGLFGIPLGVSADTVFYFLLFGAFLEESGGGKLFCDLALRLTGRMRGGSAKTSIVASGLMGTVSGSAVANVVLDGSFTISMMKRTGFSGTFAAAVEAVASTGGQIMPPVMGAGAFVMASILGVPYSEVAKAAIIPALAYYLAIFVMVDRKASIEGMKGIPSGGLPRLEICRRLHLLLPLAILVYLVSSGISLMVAATVSMGAILPVGLIRADTRMGFPQVLRSLERGARQAVSAAIPCAVAGIVVGVITFTGLGLRLSSFVVQISGGKVLLVLALVMICCIILGMGMPTTAAYIVAAAVMAPALIEVGIAPIAAHMFVFYFACLSMVTPPVALAAYAAAGIAQADIWTTGWTAFMLAAGGFVVPFAFARNPALLLQPSSAAVLIRLVITLGIGILALCAALIYRGPRRYRWILRPSYALAGFLLVDPGIATDLFGLLLLAAAWLWGRLAAGQQTGAAGTRAGDGVEGRE
jgi:TRAP transporter 4TM/12TM fusion protein